MSALRSGIWINEGGSQLHLRVDGNAVSGHYISAAKRPEKQRQYALTGMINGELIGFVVAWDDCHSLTSWCGRYTADKHDGRECIKTVWHLGRLFEDAEYSVPNPVWSSFITNTNTYYFTEETKND